MGWLNIRNERCRLMGSIQYEKHEENFMNARRIIVGVIVCALSSQLSWSQEAKPVSPAKALGYFDYSTGAFRPVAQTEDFDSSSLAATSPQTGTIVVNFNITIRSVIPATTPINCGVEATVTEVSAGGINIILDGATVVATRTGSTAKCTVTIPYSWMVSSSARLGLNYNLIAAKPAATGLLSRSSLGTIASIPVPANGATTTQTVNTVF
jgi:hypothetical protein